LIVVVTEYAAPSAKKCCRGVKNNWPRVRTWWVKGLGFGLGIGDPWASGRVMGYGDRGEGLADRMCSFGWARIEGVESSALLRNVCRCCCCF